MCKNRTSPISGHLLQSWREDKVYKGDSNCVWKVFFLFKKKRHKCGKMLAFLLVGKRLFIFSCILLLCSEYFKIETRKENSTGILHTFVRIVMGNVISHFHSFSERNF